MVSFAMGSGRASEDESKSEGLRKEDRASRAREESPVSAVIRSVESQEDSESEFSGELCIYLVTLFNEFLSKEDVFLES
jgi:hypothetical protein